MKKAVSIIFCLIFLFSFSACKGENNRPIDKGIHTLYDGIYITDISPYSGVFVEDGSEDITENIISVTLINESEKSYQLFDFSLTIGGEDYNFSVKTLLSGSAVTVLEKDKKLMPKSTDEIVSLVTDLIYFENEPSVYSDVFEISGAESIINVKNISAQDAENVTVYFKGVSDENFFGGITYRVEVGTVPAGQIVQSVALKYSPEKTKAVFVTYGS